jgi:hypothetical protein
MPVVVTAQVRASAVEIALNVTPAGIVTATGVALLVIVPLPSSPSLLYPQQ